MSLKEPGSEVISRTDMTKFYENSPVDWKGIREGIGLQQSFAWFCNKDGVLDNSFLTMRFMLPWVTWCTLSFSFLAVILEQATATSHTGKPSFNLLLYAAELFQVAVMRKRSMSRK